MQPHIHSSSSTPHRSIPSPWEEEEKEEEKSTCSQPSSSSEHVMSCRGTVDVGSSLASPRSWKKEEKEEEKSTCSQPSPSSEHVMNCRGGSVLGKRTILKSDHFSGCHYKQLLPLINGAPNYRETVTVGDLKPPPVLWHEDTGRRRMENNNGRQNPPGSISGRQLGEAAHRLVKNSLQMQSERGSSGEHRHAPRPPRYDGPAGYSYPNGSHHPPVNHGNPGWQVMRVHSDHGHGQWSVAASALSGLHNRPVHSHFDRDQHTSYRRNHYHLQSDVRRGPTVPSYPQNPQTGGYPYAPPAAQFPVPGPYGQHPRAYVGYEARGTQQWQPRYGFGRGAATNNPGPSRVYSNNQPTDNRYAAFSRGSGPSRRPPPPPGYGRY